MVGWCWHGAGAAGSHPSLHGSSAGTTLCQPSYSPPAEPYVASLSCACSASPVPACCSYTCSTKGRQNVHAVLEEGRGEWRFEIRKEFCLCLQSWMWLRPWLKFPRNIKQKIARSFGSGENKAKHPERDSSRAQCCCLDIQSAGPKGRPWSNIRYITKSRYADVQTPSVQWHFALPIPKMGAGAALSLEGISEKYEGCLYGCF